MSEDPHGENVIFPVLCHGAAAHDRAVQLANQFGPLRLDSSLTVESARQIKAWIGEGDFSLPHWSWVLGPADEADPAAVDALLKLLEERGEEFEDGPVVWAQDDGEVPGTLRSRCSMVWCPAPGTPKSSLALLGTEEGWKSLRASEDPRQIAETLAGALSLEKSWGVREVELWGQTRRVLARRHPSILDVGWMWRKF